MASSFRSKKRMIPTGSVRQHYEALLNNRFEVHMDKGKKSQVRFIMKDTPAEFYAATSKPSAAPLDPKAKSNLNYSTRRTLNAAAMGFKIPVGGSKGKMMPRQIGGEAYDDLAAKYEQKVKKQREDDAFIRLKPLPVASANQRLVHKIHIAVHEGGGCTDLEDNPALKPVIRYCWESGMPQQDVERVLRQCTLGANKLNCYKLQMRFKRNIYLICCLQVGQLLTVKKKAARIMQMHKACFDKVTHLFKNVGLIEALITPSMSIDFEDFEGFIKRDARDCRARVAEIIDYETGSVCFCCKPLLLQDCVHALRMKGYRVVYTEIGYRAHLLEDMTWPERSVYMSFLEDLFTVPEITHIYDNVRPEELPYDAVMPPEAKPRLSVVVTNKENKRSSWD